MKQKFPGSSGLASGALLASPGRLSVSSTDPAAAGTGTNTLYFHGVTGDRLALWNGSAWEWVPFTSPLALDISACGATGPAEVWAYKNAGGTVSLEWSGWTDDTTPMGRTRQNGIYLKTGDLTRRAIGSFRCSSTGVCPDFAAAAGAGPCQLWLWNHENRRQRTFGFLLSNNHTYASATWRPWNNDTNRRVDILQGLPDGEAIFMQAVGHLNSTSGFNPSLSFGLDAGGTSSPMTAAKGWGQSTPVTGSRTYVVCAYSGRYADAGLVGRHYFTVIQREPAGQSIDWLASGSGQTSHVLGTFWS